MISNYSKTVCLFTAGLQFAKHVLDSVVLNEAKFGLFVSQGLSVRIASLLLVTQQRKDYVTSRRRNVELYEICVVSLTN